MYGWFTRENGVYPDCDEKVAAMLDIHRSDEGRSIGQSRLSDETGSDVYGSSPEKDWTLDPQ